MKLSSFGHVLLVSSLLVFASGCGKSKSGGGGGGNPFGDISAYSANGQQAITNLNTWYNSLTEGAYPGYNTFTHNEVRRVSTPSCVDLLLGCVPYTVTKNVNATVVLAQGQVKSANAKLAQYYGQGGTSAYQQGTIIRVFQNRADGTIVEYDIDTNVHSALNPVRVKQITASNGKLIREEQLIQ